MERMIQFTRRISGNTLLATLARATFTSLWKILRKDKIMPYDAMFIILVIGVMVKAIADDLRERT